MIDITGGLLYYMRWAPLASVICSRQGGETWADGVCVCVCVGGGLGVWGAEKVDGQARERERERKRA